MSKEQKDLRRLSIFLSLLLRHKPEEVGLVLDPGGWACVDDLVEKVAGLNRGKLEQIVAQDDKKRYSFSPDGLRIRAVQGHSIPVDLGLSPMVPPERLYHGTARRFLITIWLQGLVKQSRQFVHLSDNAETARVVGERHGDAVVIEVDAKAMHDDGFCFYRSENGVWLADAVPMEYLIGAKW
jgi:putative RNA 2'-phosphotransferase